MLLSTLADIQKLHKPNEAFLFFVCWGGVVSQHLENAKMVGKLEYI